MHAAESFRRACSPSPRVHQLFNCGSGKLNATSSLACQRARAAAYQELRPVDEKKCLAHPLSRKLEAVAAIRPWLSFDAAAPRNAYKLFLLELYCRIPGPKRVPWCFETANMSHAHWIGYREFN